MTDIKLRDEDVSKIIASAIVLQLEPAAREAIITKAVQDHLLKKEGYSTKSRVQELVDRCAERAVTDAFDQLLRIEPFKSRIEKLAAEEMEKRFETTSEELRKLVSAAVGSAESIAWKKASGK